jgi:hypothetical protein
MHVMRIVGTVRGVPTEFDGKYLVEYEVPAMDFQGNYHGGKLITTADISKARRFQSAAEALELWRTECGVRPDGKPNRPLTAYTIEVSHVP